MFFSYLVISSLPVRLIGWVWDASRVARWCDDAHDCVGGCGVCSCPSCRDVRVKGSQFDTEHTHEAPARTKSFVVDGLCGEKEAVSKGKHHGHARFRRL